MFNIIFEKGKDLLLSESHMNDKVTCDFEYYDFRRADMISLSDYLADINWDEVLYSTTLDIAVARF